MVGKMRNFDDFIFSSWFLNDSDMWYCGSGKVCSEWYSNNRKPKLSALATKHIEYVYVVNDFMHAISLSYCMHMIVS